MCRRRAGLAVLALAVAAALGAPVGAGSQEVPTREEMELELAERLRAMEEKYERARVRADRETLALEAHRKVRAARGLDTVAVGPLRVVTRAGDAAEAARLFDAVWSDWSPVVGDAVDLSGTFFLYDPRSDIGPVDLPRHHRVMEARWRGLSPDEFARRVASAGVASEIVARMPASLRLWTGRRGPQLDDEPGDLYRQLVLTSSLATARCLEGAAEACWDALGLGLSGEPGSGWYADEHMGHSRTLRLRGWRECLARGRGALCRDFFGTPELWMEAIPLPGSFRADLLGFALEHGGEGSLRRALALTPEVTAPGGGAEKLHQVEFARGMRRALAAASGLTEEELISRWRGRLVAARPDVMDDAERSRATAFFWVLLFTFFATRSTRWRLG